MNINAYAFFASEIDSITIPASARYIGTQAFGNCTYLKRVDIYVYSDDIPHQVRIEKNAFTEYVEEVHIHHCSKSAGMFGAAYSHEK